MKDSKSKGGVGDGFYRELWWSITERSKDSFFLLQKKRRLDLLLSLIYLSLVFWNISALVGCIFLQCLWYVLWQVGAVFLWKYRCIYSMLKPERDCCQKFKLEMFHSGQTNPPTLIFIFNQKQTIFVAVPRRAPWVLWRARRPQLDLHRHVHRRVRPQDILLWAQGDCHHCCQLHFSSGMNCQIEFFFFRQKVCDK